MSRGTILTKSWLLLCCVAVSCQLSITKFEVPVAVQSGEDVELKCSYDLGKEKEEGLYVKWWLIPLHDDNRTQLYQRIAHLPGVAIRHNVVLKKEEQDTIVLSNVTPVDSGTYECEVSNISEDRKHQDLIVFTPGSGPQLNLTTVPDGPDEDEEEDVRIECEATGVAPAPDIILTVNGQEVNITEFILGPDKKGLYEIFGNATVSKEEAGGADIRCELIYVNPNITHPPYFEATVYNASGPGFTVETPEDTIKLDATPDPLQDDSVGCHSQPSWMMLLAIPVVARLASLV